MLARSVFGDNTRLRKRLREHGRQAEAEVLDVKKRPWTTAQGGAGGDTIGPTHQVYRLKLRVGPPGEPAFDAEISDQSLVVPKAGTTVPVLFDPKHHSRLVLDLDALNPFAAQREPTATPDPPRQTFHLGPDTPGAPGSGSSGGLADVFATAGRGASERAPDSLDQLAKLADLHDRGALTDAEFEAEKAKILGTS
jgi:Short C-terminal domain